MKELFCPRCEAQMHFMARERLQLGKTGWILGDLPNLLSGALEVEIFVCPGCKKLEFYASDEATEDEALPKTTCPVCGAVIDFDYPVCPNCKHDLTNR